MRDKRQKFIEIAEARVNRTIKDLQLIGNLSNKRSYEYSDADIKQMFKVLQRELDTAKNKFSENGKTGSDVFKFE